MSVNEWDSGRYPFALLLDTNVVVNATFMPNSFLITAFVWLLMLRLKKL